MARGCLLVAGILLMFYNYLPSETRRKFDKCYHPIFNNFILWLTFRSNLIKQDSSDICTL
ncbi:unnamed protein product [Moneuplotes crassus]|uniref:Uncharacterized protein n=1 Tax=Euplotes crassus TaxID=5936 RepID=A0AAD1X706_EUPCR|nr:unnamed protein product [Moneuplotes crassus]